MREVPRPWNLRWRSATGTPTLAVAEAPGPTARTAAVRRSGPSGDALHFHVDGRGVIVGADCTDSELQERAWQVKAGDSVVAFLSLWDPHTAAAVDLARAERRPLTGEFVARLGPRLCLFTMDYVPDAATGHGDLWLARHAESEASTSRVFEMALRLQEHAGLGQVVLSELNQDRDLRQGLSNMLPAFLRALDMDAGAVFMCRDSRTAELLAIHGSTNKRGYPYEDLDLTDPTMVQLAQQPRILELRPGDPLQPALTAVMKRSFRLGVLAPALSGHSVVAYLVVSTSHGRRLTLDAARTLTTLCEAVGPLVNSHIVFAKSQRDAAMLHSSQAVVRTISQSLDLHETYQEIATSAVSAVDGSSCLLLELNSESGDLVAVAASEPDASSLIGLRVRFRTGRDLATILRRRRSILVDDLIAGAGIDAEARRLLSLRSALIVPVLAHGELIGSLVLYSTGKRARFSEQDMARAGEVAEQAAIAIHNARLYRDLMHSRESIQSLAQRICEIRQDERQTFASVVHDDIIQSVVGARYLLERFRRDHLDEPLELLDEAVSVLQRTVIDARRIIWELRPPVLDELGLEASLAALDQHLGQGAGATEVHTDIGDIPALRRETATAVYKVAREATLNASHHARAGHIWIRLAKYPGRTGAGGDADSARRRGRLRRVCVEEGGSLRLRDDGRTGHGDRGSLVARVDAGSGHDCDAVRPAERLTRAPEREGAMDPPIRILIVDDHEVVRRGLESIISACDDLLVVGTASSGEEAIVLADSVDSDIVLLDLKMPGMHGLEVLPRLLKDGASHPKVIVLTVHDDEEIVLSAVKSGASGYVLKDASADELIRAIRYVAGGGHHFDEVVVKAFLSNEQHAKDLRLLTSHELEILRMVAAGATNRQVAQHLFISVDTVKSHLEAIYRKLEVSDRAHAVAVVMRKGLLE